MKKKIVLTSVLHVSLRLDFVQILFSDRIIEKVQSLIAESTKSLTMKVHGYDNCL